jgi:hypothetical protein
MAGDVDVNQPATVMFDDDEDAQHSERARHRHEEIACHDDPRMILNECGPALIASASTRWTWRQIFSHRAWRNPQTELCVQER